MEKKKIKPTFLQSISNIIFMVLVIGIGNGILKIAVQPLLLLCAAYAAVMGLRLGYTWKDMEKGVAAKLEQCMPTIFILMAVGIVVGTWVYAGTVPLLIYYGLQLISPQLFLVTAFIIVAIVSTATGTAWGSTATAGVALMGIAIELKIPVGMAAGAIIAGGVFGDKLSPLSDTTNLAPLVCGIDLFDHIKHMLYTTVPASIIGCTIWFFVGRGFDGNGTAESIEALSSSLNSIYNFTPIMLIPILIIVIGAFTKKPTVPIMLLSSVVAIVIGVVINGFSYQDGLATVMGGFNISMAGPVSMDASVATESVLKLVERGGIMSMMTIVVTIFCGYAFAGIVETIGCLDVMLEPFSKKIKKVWQLVGVTIIGSAILVFTAGVASISILMVGTLLLPIYKKMGLKPNNLSRTLEDAGTMLIPFVPWGASGIFYHEILGVTVSQFWMWAIPCYLCSVIAMILAFTGIGISRIKAPEEV